MIKFTENDLETILDESHNEWKIITKNVKEDKLEVVFTHNEKEFPFYAFIVEKPLWFSDVYTVYPKEVITIEWERVYPIDD